MLKGLLTAAAALALVGCQASEPTPAPSPAVTASASPTVSSPTPTESPSPSASESPTAFESFPPLPEDATSEERAAFEAWMSYWTVFESLMKDHSLTDLSPIGEVTGEGSPEERRLIDQVVAARESGERFRGPLLFRDVVVEIQGEEASVSFCFDRSQLEFLDASGETLESNTETLTGHMELAKEQTEWKVIESRNRIEPC